MNKQIIKKLMISMGVASLVLAITFSFRYSASKSSSSYNNSPKVKSISSNKRDSSITLDDSYSTLKINATNDSSIETSSAIVIDNVALPLYPTYKDNNKELETVKEKYSTTLDTISTKYSLDTLSDDNWQDYYSALNTYYNSFSSELVDSKFKDEIIALLEFFDIYENKYFNDNIKEELSNATTINDITQNQALLNTLPNDINSYIYNNYDCDIPTSGSTFNVSLATKYARQYATTPNKKIYKTCGSDCTNFVSQIAIAGGKSMTSDWKAYKKSKINGNYTKYTFAWCNANGFVNYFKPTNVYKDFSSVSKMAKEGQVIAYETTKDNEWDHVGYKVDSKEYSDELGYSDIEIAQHSRYYCLWTSNENNGWDVLDKDYHNVIYTLVSLDN